MSRKTLVSTLVLASMTVLAAAASLGGCQAEVSATAGTGASTPPPPPPPASTPEAASTPPPPPPAPASLKAVKNMELDKGQVKIPGEIEFDSGKGTIRETKASTDVMTTVKEFLEANPQITKLRIEGHTDNVPPKDKDMTNQKLSQQRAESVMGWLIAKGIKRDRMTAAGLGDTKSRVPNDTEAHRQQNRRTEFHVVEVDGKPYEGGAAAGGTPATGK